ncbi:MAG: hypothetical protein ACK5PP_10900 [Acidimicrobiales bacterium]
MWRGWWSGPWPERFCSEQEQRAWHRGRSAGLDAVRHGRARPRGRVVRRFLPGGDTTA